MWREGGESLDEKPSHDWPAWRGHKETKKGSRASSVTFSGGSIPRQTPRVLVFGITAEELTLGWQGTSGPDKGLGCNSIQSVAGDVQAGDFDRAQAGWAAEKAGSTCSLSAPGLRFVAVSSIFTYEVTPHRCLCSQIELELWRRCRTENGIPGSPGKQASDREGRNSTGCQIPNRSASRLARLARSAAAGSQREAAVS